MKELQFFKIAKELNEDKELHNELVKNECHFRGSINSFSLVSVSSQKPELGISNLKNKDEGEKALDKLLLKEPPKRLTPEKRLQAWIISKALNNNGKLPFDENIKFITSELVISTDEGGKVVTDILGYCEKDKQICVIELKSNRALTELVKQVKKFEDIIKGNKTFFTELLSFYGFQNHNGFSKVKKIIVWPYAKTSPLKELKKEDVDILEVTYKESYELTVH